MKAPPASVRVFAVGATGTGKSYHLREVLLPRYPRAIVLDYTGDFLKHRDRLGEGTHVAENFAEVGRLVRQLSARRDRWRVIAYLDEPDTERLTRALVPTRMVTGPSIARALGGCALVCDELSLFVRQNATPERLALWRMGRHCGLTILGASQAPADVHPLVRGQSRWLVLFHLHEPRSVGYFEKAIPAEVLDARHNFAEHECLMWDTERRVGYHLDKDAKVKNILRPNR